MQAIPKEPEDNIKFRADLHEYLASASIQVRNDFIELCRSSPPIIFKTMFWTFQPKPNIKPYGVLPFITWDWQDDEIISITNLMLTGGVAQIGKSREVGATWIILGCGLALWLFTPRTIGFVISRKEDLVDKKGDPDSLFWKLDYMLKNLPEWVIPTYSRTNMHIENLWNGSVIDGEATVENVGRGGRKTWAFCDEFPAIKHSDAECIDRSLTDTASCRIFLGTSEYLSHPFNKIGNRKGVHKHFFGWWLHPFKSEGLYWSPDINKIIIEDIDYYIKIAPKVFYKYKKGEEIKYSSLEEELLYAYSDLRISFLADGGTPNKPKWRSPWYDKQMEERDPIDVATNLDGNAIGGGDRVFAASTTNQMYIEYVKKPDYSGEIIYQVYENEVSKVKFINGGKGRLKWWGKLGGIRPVQNHNYVLGCDIALGQGQSNSVCSIFDVDLREKVGSWSDSHILPEDFAEQVYAIGYWVGGLSGIPYLNYEANGIGQVFGKRIRELRYRFVYRTTSEKRGKHERMTTWGWFNSSNTKLELLTAYNAALTACFRPNMIAKKFINHDDDAMKECDDYIFNGNQIIPSRSIEDSGGAKACHGDRVIADALCCLAAQEQPMAAITFKENIEGTIEYRKKRMRESEYENQNKLKSWLDF